MLQNYVQLAQGARPKPGGHIVEGGFNLFSADGFDVRVAWLQIIIVVVTVTLMTGFSWLITSTSLGRQQRACEQDMKMASLLGVDGNRTISLTFVMGAALAAVAGMMFLMYYGIVAFLHRLPGGHQGLHRGGCWAASARWPAPCWAAC